MIGVVLLAAVALADPYSADIELINPTFTTGSVPGVDAAWATRAGTVRVGTLLQYTRDPLVYREGGEEVGAAVGNRSMLDLGVAWDVTRRFGVRLSVPVAAQWGSDDISAAAASGIGAGDLGAGARLALLGGKTLGVALRAGVRFPTGTPSAWLGEDGFRGDGGVDFSARAGRVDVLAGASIAGRAPVATQDDFTLGSEVAGQAAVRVHVLPKRLSLHLAAVGRLGLSADAGPGALPAEAMLGAQWTPVPTLQVDLGVGHGLTEGYGSSRFRAMAGLTYVRPRPRVATTIAANAPVSVTEPGPDPLDDLADAEEPEPPPPAPAPVDKWDDGELARVEQSQIVIREPVQFDKSTADILAGSKPLLAAIAQRLVEHPEILEVVIEGHSSEEGDFAFNYELSVTRATAVMKALVEAGVDAQRLSIRGLGEVLPASANAAENRRVVFHIVQRLRPNEAPPAVKVPVPWTGAKPADATAGKPADPKAETPAGPEAEPPAGPEAEEKK
jgi:outer membrane protein OmpA-like peptidoglycan-associated protein